MPTLFFSSLSDVACPYIVTLDDFWPRSSFAVLGALSLAAAAADYFFLPETMGKKMIDTEVELIQMLNGEKKAVDEENEIEKL